MLLEPHHDGSAHYLSTSAPAPGGRVTVRVRVPTGIGVDRVTLRVLQDGEPFYHSMTATAAGRHETWWTGEVEVHNPVTSYRFHTDGPAGYGWLTATGWHRGRDVLDAGDFLLSSYAGPPDWAADAIVLQVFPDRFARSAGAESRPVPDWAVPTPWDDPIVAADGRRASLAFGRQFYGGDLAGIAEHLEHLARLSADVLYLTPIFTAGSAHRYDAATFEQVDPVLGGDQALVDLVQAAHARGIRVLGDLTTNHTGNRHEWFRRAQADPAAPEAAYYLFGTHPEDYVGWFGHRTLPKLDWRSEALREAFLRGPDSVVGRWLRPPAGLDGWRIDVANMTGRYRDVDLAHEVAAEIRATMREVRPDGWLVAEHCHIAGADLLGPGWHGTMNYAGFTRPVWTWLSHHEPGAISSDGFLGVPTGYGVPRLSGSSAVAAMREANATMPWRSQLAGMNALDTHDTPRFRTVVGSDPGRHLAGLALLFTLPGAPMLFAGAEFGLTGASGEQSRVPIPWERPETWDQDVLSWHERLAALRRASSALRRGGLRWLSIGDDALTFERESGEERILVHVARAQHEPVRLPQWWFTAAEPLFANAPPSRDSEGAWRLPAHGPAAHVWRVS